MSSPDHTTSPWFSKALLVLLGAAGLALLLWPGLDGVARLPLLIPLLAAFLIGLFGGRMPGRSAGFVALASAVISFVAGLVLFLKLTALPEAERVLSFPFYTWLSVGGLDLNLGVYVDPLSAVWTLVVTGVGSLIFLYSIAYMHGEDGFARYFCYLSLFLFSMLILVLGENLVLTFLGWEGVGLCSYLLIGFEYQKDTAAAAGRKAFLVNRIGDIGFLIAMFWTFQRFQTLSHAGMLEALTPVDAVPPLLAMAFFLGAVGKSAQAPLFVWLPDAMAGPTPVSALIHAATMVTAGVYLLCRLSMLFVKAGWALSVVAWVGALTALLAGLIALRQRDIKRVLAYSTISQLGYMFVACGVGAFGAAVFHVTTHAFFKALLFLGAGAVIHALNGQQDLHKMGGLRNQLPRTYKSMLWGSWALAGLAPFAGFFSKDEILAGAFSGHHYLLWIVGVVTAALTAFYTARMMTLCFRGDSRLEPGVHPHEAPFMMAVPLSVLKWLSLLGGALLGFELIQWMPLHHFLDPVLPEMSSHAGTLLLLALLLFAWGLAAFFWRLACQWFAGDPVRPRALEVSFPRLSQAILERFRVDEMYQVTLVGPLTALSRLCGRFDLRIIDRLYDLTAGGVAVCGNVVRFLQTGVVHAYAFWFLVGAAVLLILMVKG